MIPRKAKRDANEGEIITALRRVGASVQPLSIPNVPDMIVGFRGRNFLLEVKTAKGREETGQVEWAQLWSGQRAVVRTVGEAFAAIGLMTEGGAQ
jgi:hypothetical protein